jgi:hypothetical protein
MFVIVAACACPDRAFAQFAITPVWDSSISSDPNAATIMETINAALQVYGFDIATPGGVTIKFQTKTTGLGSSSTSVTTTNYTNYLSRLNTYATSAADAAAIAHLPSGPNNPVNGNTNITMATALARAIGINANPGSGTDCTISLNISIMNLSRVGQVAGKYDLFAVASHEIDEALGFGSALNNLAQDAPPPTGSIRALDLFRYDENGNRSFNTTLSSQAYFSIDGNRLVLGRFGHRPVPTSKLGNAH